MRCWIELNAAALKHNIKVFEQLAGAAHMVPVIKSNAYGHGLKEIFEIIAPTAPQWLGVNYLSEAETLRSACDKAGLRVRLTTAEELIESRLRGRSNGKAETKAFFSPGPVRLNSCFQ